MPGTIPKRALVTGAAGFIGSHLVARLQKEGCDTHAIIRPSSNAAPLLDLIGKDRLHVHDGTMDGMLAIVDRAQPQIIFHLASQFRARHDSQDVTQLIRSNIEFASQLAEAAAFRKIPHFINTGTAWQHFNDESFNPVNLYAATKQAFADILHYYAEANAFRTITLELFDTYGPGDRRAKLFSTLRQAAQKDETLAMSPGDQYVDLTYIDDVVEAYIAAAARLRAGIGAPFETFAVSSGHALPLREIVELWSRTSDRPLKVQWGARPHRPREMMQSWSRGITLPGWSPRVTLQEGIQKMERAPGEGTQ